MGEDGLPVPRIPVSTYRLQFNGSFRFSDARDIVPYLHKLGITDIYASPCLKTREGSLHGYDIVNHNALNPELGAEEEYNRMVAELRGHDMGQILDIVPNHMCVESSENIWWMDILENGLSSVYAGFFDIDWEPVKKELKNKVLIPVLGDQYGKVLEDQDLRLSFERGGFFINYYKLRLPVRPLTYNDILTHRLDKLEKSLPDSEAGLIELMSIITALNHLPDYTEKDREKIKERHREKEIIKKRLRDLYNKSLEIKDFINGNLRIFNGVKGDAESFNLLDSLLRKQVYRLSHWRVATEEINYRRFFDINGLAAIRMENPGVFKETHKLILELVRSGSVTGLRVDHPDGLYNPSEYFHTLQRHCFLQMRLAYIEKLKGDIPLKLYEEIKEDSPLSARPKVVSAGILRQYDETLSSNPEFKPFYIVGEKILTRGERMPDDWPIFSTTGYVFLNSLNGIFVDQSNADAFSEIYPRFIRSKAAFQDIVYEKKKLIMQVAMAGEVNTLGHLLNRISEKDRHTRDFTLNSFISAITEVIAFFPVYRTYISPSGVNDRDRRYIELAVSKAKKNNPAISGSIFDFLRDVLLLNYNGHMDDSDKKERLDFVMRFQQITGPVMAKGVEDTAFYIYNRLVSLNEVGGSPDRFGTTLETFHGQNLERNKFWPHALIATSTHDSKRSEDVRARINVLSEIPGEWRESVIRWSRINKRKKPVIDGVPVPDRSEEYLLYQTLAGAWPAGEMNEPEYGILKQRIKDYMLKAMREAKVNTSWINPNAIYEDSVAVFIDSLLTNLPDNEFLKDFNPFQKRVSYFGMLNSLSQTLLKATSPGVPDFYQGTEIWDYSLVDPDNRRPVDYDRRKNMLDELCRDEKEKGQLSLASELIQNMDDGRIKLYVTYKTLNNRRENRELFERGEYLSLETTGEKADNICAFARRLNNNRIIVLAPRFPTKISPGPHVAPAAWKWGNSCVIVPYADEGVRYRNIFTGEIFEVEKFSGANAIRLSDVFGSFPLALMERINE